MEVASGEAVALLGASGSGKSTLLNIISGLIVPDSGSVRVDSVELSTLSAEARTLFRRERIGFVFQFFHLIPTLTVMENLRLPLQLNGKDDHSGLVRARGLLERVGLVERADSFPDRLSGGEQQRVAICRALVHRPPVVLADEPTGNLDGKTADEVLKLVLALASEEQVALVVVTHSEAVAKQCSRIVRMAEGKLA
jgi:putative ABC transport system ATP-binding protein